MRRALALGREGQGCTSPNPPVGAVVVRDGRELGVGWHRRCGEPHAEIEAMSDATAKCGAEALSGATLYVTLEPCSTAGRTGACTSAILRAGIGKVVFGATDPNPVHAGRSRQVLEEGGVEVRSGIERGACEKLIRGFAKVQSAGLPWVIAKTAMSLDGRITRPTGEGQWLSSAESRMDVQRLRAEVDAIVTSGRTVRADNPRLTVRNLDVKVSRAQPWRVVLTSREDGIPEESQLLRDEHSERTLVFVGQRIESVLRTLVLDHGVCTVLLEAGGGLLGRFLDEGWADEMVVYLAPLLTGGEVPAVGGEGAAGLGARLRIPTPVFERIGSDVRVRGVLGGRGGRLER